MNAEGVKALLHRLTWQIPAAIVGSLLASAATFYFLQTRPMAELNGEIEQQQSMLKVAEKSAALFDQMERALLTTRDWGVAGVVKLDDVEGFNRVMMPTLRQRAAVNSIHFANASGR